MRLFEFITLTSLGALGIVIVVTVLLWGTGFAIHMLAEGVKFAMS